MIAIGPYIFKNIHVKSSTSGSAKLNIQMMVMRSRCRTDKDELRIQSTVTIVLHSRC